MNPMLLVSALVMGLLGSTHCVLMCGGVVAMTCSAVPLRRSAGDPSPPRRTGSLRYVLAYNGGRITSYAAAGALSGAVGASLRSFGVLSETLVGLRFAAGILMIAVGLYLSGWSASLRWAERAGEPIWRRVAPLARKLLPVRAPSHAFALGLLWGWMPCGLVYAALAASVTGGSLLGGATTMLAFGLGTLPMLVAMGSVATFVKDVARSRWIRTVAGVAVVSFGLVQLAHAGTLLSSIGGPSTPRCCAGHVHVAPAEVH